MKDLRLCGALTVALSLSLFEKAGSTDSEQIELDCRKYGVSVRVPKAWRLVVDQQDSMVFGLTVPTSGRIPAAFKCEIGTAPNELEDFRWRIQRRAESSKSAELSLGVNEIRKTDSFERLVTQWDFQTLDKTTVHDVVIRVISHRQLYTFTLRTPGHELKQLQTTVGSIIEKAEFSRPDTGLEMGENRVCVQKQDRFAMKLPKGWEPSFPPVKQVHFIAHGAAEGIWRDNVLIVAAKRRPIDLDALARTMPEQLKSEDPHCMLKSCATVRQGKSGIALETVVETRRGPFQITVLERRYPGRRFNYEIKFTMTSSHFEEHEQEIREALDSFQEYLSPEDLKNST